MEFIALLLLAPLIWSTESTPSPSTIAPTTLEARAFEASAVGANGASDKGDREASLPVQAHLESVDGQWLIRPPQDQSLTMTVVEHRPGASTDRSPAAITLRRIDVIVSAP